MSVISPPLVAPDRHAGAVDELVRRYRALGPDVRVRLGKKTSNLFRFGDRDAPRLDVSAFSGVLDVDPEARTADVLGMTTYEELVDATLRPRPDAARRAAAQDHHPRRRRHRARHRVAAASATGCRTSRCGEMDVLTGDGRVVVAPPDNEHADLFRGFPNSYGTLGYALRLRIELEPVKPYVAPAPRALRHRRGCSARCARSCRPGHEGEPVDFVDGTWFARDEQYVTLGSVRRRPRPRRCSDYTGQASTTARSRARRGLS